MKNKQMTLEDFRGMVYQLANQHFPDGEDGNLLNIEINDCRHTEDFQLIPIQKSMTIKTQEDFERAMDLMATNIVSLSRRNEQLWRHYRCWQEEQTCT